MSVKLLCQCEKTDKMTFLERHVNLHYDNRGFDQGGKEPFY
jgi:hypothetical protein